MKIYASDFESSKKDDETWVYLWCLRGLRGTEHIIGRGIEEWVKSVFELDDESEISFFNLAFDGSFIGNWLLSNKEAIQVIDGANYYFNSSIRDLDLPLYSYEENFKAVLKKEKRKGLYYKVGINDMGIWYRIDIWHEYKHYIITDAAKLFPGMSLEEVGEKFLGYKQAKLDYDYAKVRYPDTVLEEHDYDYIKRDVDILADSLCKLKYDWNITEHTLASAGMTRLKDSWLKRYGESMGLKKNQGNRIYRFFLPELKKEEYNFCSLSYKGGICHLNEKYMDDIYGDGSGLIGLVFDANSLYSSVMKDEFLPIGEGIYFDSKYKRDNICELLREDDSIEPLYIQRFRCSFKLKAGKIPFVVLRNNDFKMWWNRDNEIKLPQDEPLSSSDEQVVELVMTSIDYANFLRNYDVEDLEIIEGYVYKGVNGLFDDYVNFWSGVKEQATKENNTANRTIAKLMQNAISGKFGAKMSSSWKMIYMKDGVLKYKILKKTEAKQEYMPMSAFITSYGRQRLLNMIDEIREIGYRIYGADVFIYCDTDSVHCFLVYEDLPEDFKKMYLNQTELGYWKVENEVYKAVFLRNKTYLEQKVSNTAITGKYEKDYKLSCSGFPKKTQDSINFENFKKGKPFKNAKLRIKQVKGGCALIPEDFEIK